MEPQIQKETSVGSINVTDLYFVNNDVLYEVIENLVMALGSIHKAEPLVLKVSWGKVFGDLLDKIVWLVYTWGEDNDFPESSSYWLVVICTYLQVYYDVVSICVERQRFGFSSHLRSLSSWV